MAKPNNPEHEYMDTGALTEDAVPEPAEDPTPREAGAADSLVPEGVEIG